MSKVFKSIGKGIKRVAKFVKKNFSKLVMAALVIYTLGAGLGAWGAKFGVQAGAGFWTNVKAAWTGIGKAIGGKIAGIFGKGSAAGVPIDASAAGATSSAPGAIGITDFSVGAGAPSVASNQVALKIGGEEVLSGLTKQQIGAQAASGGAGSFLMSPGGGIMAATGLNMAGGYYMAKDEEKKAAEELDRLNRESFAYGYNRYGQKSSGYQPINWNDLYGQPQVTQAGLMAPSVAAPSVQGPSQAAPQPQYAAAQSAYSPRPPSTLDELIAARNQNQVV
jgi:hypothetical protein